MDDQSEGAHQKNEADQQHLKPNDTAEQHDQNMSGQGRGSNGEHEEEKVDPQRELESEWNRLEERREHLREQINAHKDVSEQVDQALREVNEARRR